MKEVVCKPTKLESVVDELDKQASVPRRGDGHHGYYIEVEVRRHKDVSTSKGKRPPVQQKAEFRNVAIPVDAYDCATVADKEERTIAGQVSVLIRNQYSREAANVD